MCRTFRGLEEMSLPEFLELIDSDGLFWIAKRLSGNDTGITGAHQVGLYLPRWFFESVFPSICTTDTLNPDAYLDSVAFPQSGYAKEGVRAVYYNNRFFPEGGSRNEFRLTRWGGRRCPLQDPANTGALIVFAVATSGGRQGMVWVAEGLLEESVLEDWIGAEVYPGEFHSRGNVSYGRRPAAGLPELSSIVPETWHHEFPSGAQIFELVQRLVPFSDEHGVDRLLLRRREAELRLFLEVERLHVEPLLRTGFADVDSFIRTANRVTNRRKARAGRSLELHLAAIFRRCEIEFEAQVVTEGRKRPDFVFPGAEAYHNALFPAQKLHMLAAKTCCKDRWRQVLSEAERIHPKHLFTLQEGASENQLAEMANSGVVLVVPAQHRRSFPEAYRDGLMDLHSFVRMRRGLQQRPGRSAV